MSDRFLASLGILTIAFAAVSLVPQSAAGQDRVAGAQARSLRPRPARGRRPAPRTANRTCRESGGQ